MAYTTPTTHVAGETLPAADWNVLCANDVAFSPLAGAWTSFTPTLSNIVAGNGVHASRYMQVGRMVSVFFKFTFGTTTTISGPPVFSLPVAASGNVFNVSQCMFLDFGSNRYIGMCELDSVTNVVCHGVLTSGTYATQSTPNATVPFTWTTNDSVTVGLVYESAS